MFFDFVRLGGIEYSVLGSRFKILGSPFIPNSTACLSMMCESVWMKTIIGGQGLDLSIKRSLKSNPNPAQIELKTNRLHDQIIAKDFLYRPSLIGGDNCNSFVVYFIGTKGGHREERGIKEKGEQVFCTGLACQLTLQMSSTSST